MSNFDFSDYNNTESDTETELESNESNNSNYSSESSESSENENDIEIGECNRFYNDWNSVFKIWNMINDYLNKGIKPPIFPLSKLYELYHDALDECWKFKLNSIEYFDTHIYGNVFSRCMPNSFIYAYQKLLLIFALIYPDKDWFHYVIFLNEITKEKIYMIKICYASSPLLEYYCNFQMQANKDISTNILLTIKICDKSKLYLRHQIKKYYENRQERLAHQIKKQVMNELLILPGLGQDYFKALERFKDNQVQ